MGEQHLEQDAGKQAGRSSLSPQPQASGLGMEGVDTWPFLVGTIMYFREKKHKQDKLIKTLCWLQREDTGINIRSWNTQLPRVEHKGKSLNDSKGHLNIKKKLGRNYKGKKIKWDIY